MPLDKESVVVAHPGKQHSYRVVLAMQSAGLLQRFFTGTYFKSRSFPYTLIHWLPRASRERVLREFRKRHLEGLEERRITALPVVDGVARTVDRLRESWQEGKGGYSPPISHRLFDAYVGRWLAARRPRPSLFYGFLGTGLGTLRVAKRLGITTILDVPTLLDGPRIVADERKRLGLPVEYTRMAERLLDEVRIADYVVAPSEAVARSMAAIGVLRDRVLVLPFGVDISGFLVDRNEDGRPDRKFRALFAGKFALHKGVHHLLEAWEQLSLPNAELVIAGPPIGARFVESMRSRYRGRFVELGNIPHHEIRNVFADVDIFVFPSLWEGSALVTYEALASGLPCIVTSEAGSVVRDGIEGFVIPAGDVGAIRDRILQLYQDPALRRSMGEAARARAMEHSWEEYQLKLVTSVGELMGRNQHGRTSSAAPEPSSCPGGMRGAAIAQSGTETSHGAGE